MKIAYAGIDMMCSALKGLLNNGCEIMEIFTCRTDNITEFNTEVVETAQKLGIPYSTEPITEAQLKRLYENGCEVFFCAGYYYRIPIIEKMPMLNFHPEYLPNGRGAWPMPVALLNGCKTSGVSLHKMTEKFDEGDIVLQKKIDLEDNENLQTMTKKINQEILSIVDTLFQDFEGYYRNAVPQTSGEYWKCPTGKDWTMTEDMSLEQIDRVLRAFYGYECLWKAEGKIWEIIGGKLETTSGKHWSFEIKGKYLNADSARELNVPFPTNGEAIDFKHQQKIECIRNKYGHDFSSHSFASLYLWRRAMRLEVFMGQDMFVVKTAWKGRNTWFFPCGNRKEIQQFLEMHKGEADFKLVYVRREDLKILNELYPNSFEAKRDDTSDEYLYDRQEHLDLKGKFYANVRAQYNKVLREQDVHTEILNDENIHEAEEIIKSWETVPRETIVLSDEGVDLEGLEKRKKLGIQGIVIYLSQIPSAVVAGYPLSFDTMDMFLAKERERVPGLGYYAKREFFRFIASAYKYINIEEDLGIQGLREMKKRLNPVRVNEIWEVTWNHEKE